ncbi:histidine kinase/DNA gyrase B/HSP90-like ATPase [Leptospira meyeri]|uniref:Histidine kinase/DNA gyrase B/HSP90-like ATPase n=1 Tax=Leptospira meyeri TaxID=29508 RepID=A0A4R8MJZ8_LEPME|nr:ATP-binding protein [Leptospira meyeri]EKJ86153.1 GHKL domain protein [Leptospira meyeri serovar Hardjo str. Went 5]TDY66536.1 histidine kinase/DNA gyrase B/HSP90-like ATPase [Leptospira meyeri]
MYKAAKFKVDPALTKILGESYTSVEAAIKELVDNCYDADSTIVSVEFPNPFDHSKIIITDNGDGMTPDEVRDQYLKIASSRTSRKGDTTYGKKRKVKGRKGIGKFAGLMIASFMEVKTKSKGQETTIVISKEAILGKDKDLDSIELPINSISCDKNSHGTTITLTGLNQNFTFPNPEKLKQILSREYLRENDFSVTVNNEEVSVKDIPGQKFEKEITLSNGQTVTAIATITDKAHKYHGVNYRVDGKIIGKPNNLLSENELIPQKVQKRLHVEVKADCLLSDTTADWGEINESSKLKQEIEEALQSWMVDSLQEGCKQEMILAKARHQKKINAYLSKLPEFRQQFAKAALEKVIERFWTEDDTKIDTIISVMIDAFEKGHYWAVLENIDEANDHHIEKLADAFNEFGLYEITMMTHQASAKAKFLDKLQALIDNSDTLEATVHQALANNLWVFGYEYSHYISNQSLKKACEQLCDKIYRGENANKRPDLFLGMAFNRERLLIEFKRPSHTLTRNDEAQAQRYRDELSTMFPNDRIIVKLIGGDSGAKIKQLNNATDLTYHSYTEIISNARANYEWLINELTQSNG